MADDPSTETTGPDVEPGAPSSRPAPRPSPAASAASRARRIGGATRAGTPGAAHRSPEPATVPADGATQAEPIELSETSGLTDETTATSDGPDSDAAAAKDRPEVPFWLTWAPAAILVAGAVAMAVIVGIVSHGVWWGKDSASQASVNSLRQQVSAAAKTCLAATNTYKYTDLDAFEKAGTACTTGTQTTQFRKAVDTLIRKNAPKLKFSQTAQINKAAIESVNGNQWTILLYGQLAVTNVNTPNGRTDPFAAVVRMEKVHGQWLISSLRTVSSPVN